MVPKLLIFFVEIPIHTHGNFEQRNGVLEFCIIIIINYNYLLLLFLKKLHIERENRRVEIILGSLFRLPVTSYRLWFV
jgi:hypothetical protein